MRRRTAAVMATILAATLGATPVLADELSVFNSKSEIEEQMEDMASDYSDENDVDMEVYYSQDTVAAHLSTKYASKDPYVLSMVDAKDIYSLGPDHALDLSDQPWVKDSNQIISIDGNNVNDEGKRRSVSIVTQGVYDEQNGVHTLRYSEQDEESGENVETTILVEGDRVVVSDDLSLTQITFRRGQRFSSIVEDSRQVPMEFGVFPTRVRAEMNESGGTLDLRYQTDLDGVVMGDNSIRLSYRQSDV